MRDAIQGMLTMSRMGEGNQLFRNKRSAQRLQQRNQMLVEEEAKLEQCYKDEEYSKCYINMYQVSVVRSIMSSLL
jgi:hypothetical protein